MTAQTLELLTVEEVAAALRVSRMTIYRCIRSHDLEAIRVGRNYRIRSEAITAYLKARVTR